MTENVWLTELEMSVYAWVAFATKKNKDLLSEFVNAKYSINFVNIELKYDRETDSLRLINDPVIIVFWQHNRLNFPCKYSELNISVDLFK